MRTRLVLVLLAALLASAHRPVLAGTPARRLTASWVVVDGAAAHIAVGTLRGDLRVVSAATGRELWARSSAVPLWLDGSELLVLDRPNGGPLALVVLDVQSGSPLRTFEVTPPLEDVEEEATRTRWSAAVEPAPGAGADVLRISWDRRVETGPDPRLGGGRGSGAVFVVPAYVDRGSFDLDFRAFVAVPPPRGRSPERPALDATGWLVGPVRSGDDVSGVRAAAEVIDAEGRRFPAFRWLQVDPTGAELGSRLLDAGYRTRVVPSVDGTAFATAYAEPDGDRAMAWSIYDTGSGERRGKVRPVGVGDRFVTTPTLLVFEAAAPEIGLVAYDLATGAERWREASRP